MPVTAVEALAPPPQPKPERPEPSRDDSDFARELESAAPKEIREEEPRREPESGRPDGAPQPTQVTAAPALLVAASPETDVACAAPAVAGPELAPDAAPAPAAAAPAGGILPAQALAPASGQPSDPAPESASPGAKPSAPASAEAATPQDAAEPEIKAAADEARRDGKAEAGKWTSPEAAKPGAAMAAMGAAPSAQAQAAVGTGERLAAVKVLRQIDGAPAEGKPAPPPLAPAANHSPAAPAGVLPTFDAHLPTLDSSTATAGTGPVAAARPAAAPAPAAQIAVHMAQAVEDGVRRLEVRLTPAELGRVEVKLDVGHDGRVLAVVSADRQDTLDLLQRDARGLERALQEAGIRADGGSLSFSLRQQEREGWAASNGRFADASPHEREGAPAAEPIAQRSRASLRALDISV